MNITRGKIDSAQKVVIYGPEGIGKSTFASHFPEPLFIDTEGSTKQLDVARLDAPSSWMMLMSQIDYVIANPNICKTLVIDTADWAEKLTMQYICSKHQVDGIESIGYGKGYTYLEEDFGRMLNKLSELVNKGVHVVITAHSKITKFEQPDEMGAYDRWELKLQKKTAPLVKEWADMVLFANYKTIVINVDNQGATKGKNKAQGGERVMYTSHMPAWDAKNRHGLHSELPFDFNAIAHIFNKSEYKKVEETVKEPTPKEVSKESNIAAENMYFYHPESDCTLEILPGDKIPEDQGVENISKEEYDKLINEELKKANDGLMMLDDRFTPLDKTDISQRAFEIKEKDQRISWGKAFEMAKEECENKKENTPKIEPIKEEVSTDTKLVENKALNDLMVLNSVSVEEIQKVVADRGYYPLDTPIENYDESFISGVLVGAWKQMYELIKENK